MGFVIKGLTAHCSHDLGNAIRRAILNDVETVGVASVTFTKNESVMSDKQLAHRIGLLVFDAQPSSEFALNVCAPPGSMRLVTAQELTPLTSGSVITKRVPLVLLGPGASLRLKVRMRSGCGREHARFCPAEAVRYQPAAESHVRLTVEGTGSRQPDEIVELAYAALLRRIENCLDQLDSCGTVARTK